MTGRHIAWNEEQSLEVLKIVWGQRPDGVWAIQAMKSVSLQPSGEGDPDYYAVEDGLFHAQPNHIGTISTVMGQSIVPIAAILPEESRLMCLGTGFFVSCSGLLITAAHVITDPIERKYGGAIELDDLTWQIPQLRLGIMVPTNPILETAGFVFCEIEWATFLAERRENPLPIQGVDLKLTSDIAICKVAHLDEAIPFQPLSIVQHGLVGVGMAVGKTVAAVGYAGMLEETLLEQTRPGVIAGDFEFQLHVSKGEILERFPDNMESKIASTPGPCFSAAAQYSPGMSGSPIFDEEGIYVHGVVSKGWVDENGPATFGYGSMLGPSMTLPIKQLDGAHLLNLLASGSEGMAQLSVPDA